VHSNTKPKPAPAGSHPIWNLVTNAERELEEVKARQSKTLEQAVIEYRKRYNIPPPPNFDKWFAFAQAKGVQLIDEFDMIHDSLVPFWGLKPATIRARAKEALGFDNALLGISIRNGKTTHVQGGSDWQREATVGMMGKYIEWLPSMDLCFNLHDEPRVVVPHDDLARLVQRGLEVNMPRANLPVRPRNEFTKSSRRGSMFLRTSLHGHTLDCHALLRVRQEQSRMTRRMTISPSMGSAIWASFTMLRPCLTCATHRPSARHLASSTGQTHTTSFTIFSPSSHNPRSRPTTISCTRRPGTGTRRLATTRRRIIPGKPKRTSFTGVVAQPAVLAGMADGVVNTASNL
jgi:hypothetical protein